MKNYANAQPNKFFYSKAEHCWKVAYKDPEYALGCPKKNSKFLFDDAPPKLVLFYKKINAY